MLAIIFLAIMFALLGVGGVFALMAKSSGRRGQSGSMTAPAGAKQGRAPGLD